MENYDKNKNNSKALMFNGLFYSALTSIFIVVSLVKTDVNILYVSIIPFILMVISLGMSLIFMNNDERVKTPVVFLGFVVILPLGFVISIIGFIVSSIVKIFSKEGGDQYD